MNDVALRGKERGRVDKIKTTSIAKRKGGRKERTKGSSRR